MNDIAPSILTSIVVSSAVSGVFLWWNEMKRRESEEKKYKMEATLKLTELAHGQINELLKHKGRKVAVPKVLKTFLDYRKWVDQEWNK